MKGEGKRENVGRKIAKLLFALSAAGLLFAGPSLRAASVDTNRFYQDAIKLYEKGDYEKALKGFLKVMRLDPSNAEAREYMLRCSQKIVETKLGGEAAETVEKEIETDKQIQVVSPEAPPALSQEYLTPIIPAAAVLPAVSSAPASAAGNASMDRYIQDAAAEMPSNARDLLAERGALTDDLRRRYLGKGNVVDVSQSGGRLEVTFYLNRLFLPLSDSLRPESFSVLNDIRDLVKSNPRQAVSFTSVDNISPAIRNTMADLSVRRTNVVFSYLLHSVFAAASPATK
jgi:outer membrane protein OmpA-like peptidoglycan-associated protein